MKKNIILLFSLLVSACAVAQPVTTTVPFDSFGQGGTRTTTVTNDGLGTETTTVEYRDGKKPPRLMYRVVSTKNLLTGDSIVNEIHYDGYGENKRSETITVFKDGKFVNSFKTTYLPNGEIDEEWKWEIQPDGTHKSKIFNPKTGEWEDPFKPSNSTKTSSVQACTPRLTIFGGYSYLSCGSGNNNVSFPIGIQISALYGVSDHIGVGISFGNHTSKKENWKYTRSFIIIDGQYGFGNVNYCNRKIIPDVHLLAGLGSETAKYNSGNNSTTSSNSALAIGAGLGLNLNVNKKLAVRLFQADYILTRFYDESQHNFRASTGLVLKLGSR